MMGLWYSENHFIGKVFTRVEMTKERGWPKSCWIRKTQWPKREDGRHDGPKEEREGVCWNPCGGGCQVKAAAHHTMA